MTKSERVEDMSREESPDAYQFFVERTGRAATIVTSNRDTSEGWEGMLTRRPNSRVSWTRVGNGRIPEN